MKPPTSRTTSGPTHRPGRRSACLLALACIAIGAASPALAQSSGNGYLFEAPAARLTFRGGYALATAGSDLFSFTTDELTLKKSDFSSFTAGVELALPITPRLDFSIDASYARSKKGSEFRHFTDNNDLPIEQTTAFERLPIMANLRYNLAPTGRSIGKLAWIPTTIVPYVGGGAGTMWYRFNQEGDFIDFTNNKVFHSQFNSSSWAPAAQGFAGVDFSLTPMIALSADARYVWAKGSLSTDFGGFDKLDLSGVSATLGLTFRL
ncbi:MAG: outer membrane beta-barrel protein [bacterium]